MTFLQIIEYIYIKLRYKLTQRGQDYDMKTGQDVIIVSLNGEKIKGKVISIENFEDITNFYKIQGTLYEYTIDDCHILCVFNIS